MAETIDNPKTSALKSWGFLVYGLKEYGM